MKLSKKSIQKKSVKIQINADTLSSIFCVERAMRPENGEDSYYYAVSGNRSIVAAFDGCGGIGSRHYKNYSDKTGAYVASRAVCGGIKAWFENESADIATVENSVKRVLNICNKFADKSGRLVGSLGKSFPTTAAIISVKNNIATCIWAGDSRCYMLDCDGLHQLSEDDVSGEDALSNIANDGVLTNVICASAGFVLHTKSIVIDKPCMLFVASDGCFGYLNSPMEFEYLITSTLLNSVNIEQWKQMLAQNFNSYTGDDYTLCAALYGFGSFQNIQQYFSQRNFYVNAQYITSQASLEEKWEHYKKAYSAFL